MLALTDAIGIILWSVFSVSSQVIWMPFHYLVMVMLFKDHFFKWMKHYLAGFVLIYILNYLVLDHHQVFFVFVVHLIIFSLFTKQFIGAFYQDNAFSIFYFLLIFYEVITIFKVLAFMRDITVGIEVFFVGTLVQIFIGIAIIGISFWRETLKPKSLG